MSVRGNKSILEVINWAKLSGCFQRHSLTFALSKLILNISEVGHNKTNIDNFEIYIIQRLFFSALIQNCLVLLFGIYVDLAKIWCLLNYYRFIVIKEL